MTLTEQILKEAREELPHLFKSCECCEGSIPSHYNAGLFEFFLTHSLTRTREECAKEVEYLYPEYLTKATENTSYHEYAVGYKEAIFDAASKIREIK